MGSALSIVDRGGASVGIEIATNAKKVNKVRVVEVFPDNIHMPIAYLLAVAAVQNADAIKPGEKEYNLPIPIIF